MDHDKTKTYKTVYYLMLRLAALAVAPGFVRATKTYFHNETAAFLHLDGFFWPDGPVCPHCGPVGGKHDDLGKTRVGLRKGSDCRQQLAVRVGTVFASAHIHSTRRHRPSSSCAPAKKARAHRIHRIPGVKYKTLWFLCERIRGRCALATLCVWRRGLVERVALRINPS
jgi:hypothetical protein